MNKDIKYLIEDIVKFDVTDYESDQDDIVNSNTVHKITDMVLPKTSDELIALIKERMKENKFGDNDLYFPDLSDIDISNIDDMCNIFYYALNPFKAVLSKYIKPVKLNLSSWDTSNLTRMGGMFNNCSQIIYLDLSGWDTSNVTTMYYMFKGCHTLSELKLSGWNTSNVKDMDSMFRECYRLKKLDLSGWDVSNINLMCYMFYKCRSLKLLNLTGWNISNFTDTSFMFLECTPKVIADQNLKKRFNILLEKNLQFNPADYNDDEDESINKQAINHLTYKYFPETKEELTRIIKDRYLKNNGDNLFIKYKFDLTDIDVSRITDMSNLFREILPMYFSPLIELDLSTWDTSNVIDMSHMFEYCQRLYKVDLSGFDTSNVLDMSYMFSNCKALKELNLSNFNTSNVINMEQMFWDCESLKELDLSNFDTSSVINMEAMFSQCRLLTRLNISGFDTSSVIYMSDMFLLCLSLKELHLSNFTTNKLKDAHMMFSDCRRLSKLDLSNWDVSNKIDMSDMFWNCNSLETLPDWYQKYQQRRLTEDLVNFNPSDYVDDIVSNTEVNNLLIKYHPLTKLELYRIILKKVEEQELLHKNDKKAVYELDLTDIDVHNITDMGCLFNDGLSWVKNPVRLNISNWNTENVVYMNHMFSCNTLIDLDLSNFNTSNVTNMECMFCECESLTELDLSNFDTSKVINMSYMFYNCESLTKLDLSGWNTSKVTNMDRMFKNCHLLTYLDISHFDISHLYNMDFMFGECQNLINLFLPPYPNSFAKLSKLGMFDLCIKLNDIPKWYKNPYKKNKG